MSEPTVEMFSNKAGKPRSDAYRFFDSLPPLTPTMLPEPYASQGRDRVISVRSSVQKKRGGRIALRTHEGKLWACYFPPEESK